MKDNNVERESTSQAVRVPKTAELIAEKLRRRIVLGELKAGDALPAEPEMMNEFNVSRSSLREAFRVLEAESLIEVKRGVHGGARIKLPKDEIAAKSVGLLLQIRGASLKEVLKARLIIEPPLMHELAETRTESCLEILREHLVYEAENIDDFKVFALATAELHRILMQQAGNVVLSLMTGMLDEIFRRHVTHFIAGARDDQLELNKVALTNHNLLIDMIEARNGEAAELVWRQHMQRLTDVVLGELGETSILDLYGSG